MDYASSTKGPLSSARALHKACDSSEQAEHKLLKCVLCNRTFTKIQGFAIHKKHCPEKAKQAKCQASGSPQTVPILQSSEKIDTPEISGVCPGQGEGRGAPQLKLYASKGNKVEMVQASGNEAGTVLETYDSQDEAAHAFGCSASKMSKLITRKTHSQGVCFRLVPPSMVPQGASAQSPRSGAADGVTCKYCFKTFKPNGIAVHLRKSKVSPCRIMD
jgi:hypothetical protein